MSMQVRYIGNPYDNGDQRRDVEMFGCLFTLGETVDVSDLSEDQQRRLRANSHFEVVSTAAAAPPPKRRGRPPKVREEAPRLDPYDLDQEDE